MTMLRRGCSVTVMVVVMRMAVRVIVVVVMGHNVVVFFTNSWGCNWDAKDTRENVPTRRTCRKCFGRFRKQIASRNQVRT